MREVNPLKALRLAHGLTMQHVASVAGVSRQYAIRAEQGVYRGLPERYAEGLLDLIPSDSDLETLGFEYEAWQRLRREESFGSLTPGFDFHVHDSLIPEHPFVHWREHSGLKARIQVSKLFCVHPALIFKFEEQDWLVTTPPNELLVALKQAGYHPNDLDLFCVAYTAYKIEKRKGIHSHG